MVTEANSLPNLNHAEQLLLQLRESFLAEAAERCDDLEYLVLALRNKDGIQENFDELYRKVHSLKGSAGTHGVRIISTICHHFEDHLTTLGDDFTKVSEDYIDVCLAYTDLIRSASEGAMAEDSDFTEVENELERIRQNLLKDNQLILIVESTPLMAKVCQNAFSNLPVQTIVIDNGLQALERLLQERFDYLVTGNALKTLNGVALISALKASESVNKDIKIIMLTSTTDIQFPVNVKPDYLIHKNPQLAQNLADVIEGLSLGKR